MGKPRKRSLINGDSRLSNTMGISDNRSTPELDMADPTYLLQHHHDNPNSIPPLWDSMDMEALMTNMQATSDTSSASFPLAAADWSCFDNFHSSGLSSTSTYSSLHTISDSGYRSEDAISPELANDRTGQEHDCQRDACAILQNMVSSSSGAVGGVEAGSSTAHSFDGGYNKSSQSLTHALRANREAIEQLGSLLNCACAKSPHQMLLHASIVSRILIRYKEEVSRALKSTVEEDVEAKGCQAQLLPQCTGRDKLRRQITTSSSDQPRMVIGSLTVDDEEVEAVVKVHLIFGELRKIAQLLEGFCTQMRNTGPVDHLSQTLYSWLSNEHAAIVNFVQTGLAEMRL